MVLDSLSPLDRTLIEGMKSRVYQCTLTTKLAPITALASHLLPAATANLKWKWSH